MRFRYATIKDLRDEGVQQSGATGANDERILALIERFSGLINRLTDQWFLPQYLQQRVDGKDTQFLSFLNKIPIIQLDTLYAVNDVNDVTEVDSGLYAVGDRYVELHRSRGPWGVRWTNTTKYPHPDQLFDLDPNFREGALNYRMDGYFGWLENVKSTPVTTTVAINMSADPDSAVMELDDVTGILVDDVALIRNEFAVIVSRVDPITNKIYFDPIPERAAAGDAVTVLGQVPEMIRWATVLLATRNRFRITDTKSNRQRFAGRLIMEKTDNYQYRLSGPGDGSQGIDWSSSGDPEVDRILSQYTAPLHVGYV